MRARRLRWMPVVVAVLALGAAGLAAAGPGFVAGFVGRSVPLARLDPQTGDLRPHHRGGLPGAGPDLDAPPDVPGVALFGALLIAFVVAAALTTGAVVLFLACRAGLPPVHRPGTPQGAGAPRHPSRRRGRGRAGTRCGPRGARRPRRGQ